ncbi:MAG: RpoL/Rpb11 RNA polymerase subunit family protein [Candidatus Thorarchaeota archaeon]
MAKKKVEAKEKENLEDIDDNFFDDDDVESHYPEVEKVKVESPKKAPPDSYEDSEILDEEGYFGEDLAIEDLEPEITYKYLDLTLNRGTGENDYSLKVKGQSHGLLNALVKHLLTIEGVNVAAYKVTQIDPPELFIRLEKGFDIKDILHKGIDLLRNEIIEVQKAFNKVI